jgi:flagellar M-ring protein FliF
MLNQVRLQFMAVWGRQTTIQKVILVSVVVAAVVLIGVVANWAGNPSYAVAFSGLSESDAGQIVSKLKDNGTQYKLGGGGSILVPANQVYEVRLSMAKDGLPQSSNVGYELFNTGNTFGMTEFTQRVNYQRALEGELERTIGSMDAIQAVRVHIVIPEKALLSQDQSLTTASITVQEKPGKHLDQAQVRAITHLAASSVENLKPEEVVVVDVNGNMLASGTKNDLAGAVAQSDDHRAVELAASADLAKKVQHLLDQALGPNKSVVQASVLMDWNQRETTQQSYAPNGNAIRSSQVVSEVYTTTGSLAGGIPGSGTNLPPVVNTSSSGAGKTAYARHEKTTNYEMTQTQTKETLAPGQINKQSVSVLVDGITDTAELDKLKNAIAAAAGIDAQRGDTLAVETLAFDRTSVDAQVKDLETNQRYELYWRIAEAGLVVLVLIILFWYVSRLLNNLRLSSSQAWTPILKPVSEMALPAGHAHNPQIESPAMNPALAAAYQSMGATPPAMPPKHNAPLPEPVPLPRMPEPAAVLPVLPSIDFEALEALRPQAEQLTAADEQLTRIVAEVAEENPAALAEVIQMWLNEELIR